MSVTKGAKMAQRNFTKGDLKTPNFGERIEGVGGAGGGLLISPSVTITHSSAFGSAGSEPPPSGEKIPFNTAPGLSLTPDHLLPGGMSPTAAAAALTQAVAAMQSLAGLKKLL